MSLQATNLYIQASQLPATFKGTPNDFLSEIVKRMRIVSPTGTNFIFTGDVQPSSNVGPWLKNGTEWWVWDPVTKTYVPQSGTPFAVGATAPVGSSQPIWLRTTKDATDADPNDYGQPVGWFVFDGSFWEPVLFHIGSSTPTLTNPPIWLRTTQDFTGASPTYGHSVGWYFYDAIANAWLPFSAVLSGSTFNRPTDPTDFQMYYDTTISVLIWWERGMWRTVTGAKGDVKAVVAASHTEALDQNPGWALLVDPTSTDNWAGRIIVQATHLGATAILPPDTNVASKAQGQISPSVGSTDKVDLGTGGSYTGYQTPWVALWHLYKL